MKLKKREKILASVAGGLLLFCGLWFLALAGDSRPVARLLDERQAKQAELEKQEAVLAVARRDAKQLADWRHRALPSDPTVARSLYQTWLLGLAGQAHFRQFQIESREAGVKRGIYTNVSCTIHCRTNLADLAAFLHGFYTAGHMQQLRRLEIKPQENTRELDVTMTIDALSLPDADRKDQLSAAAGHTLQLTKLEDYRAPISQRDLFTADKPPSESRPVDPAAFTFVTGLTEVDGARRVWLWNRMESKRWILEENGEFRIGSATGKVVSIPSTKEVIVEYDGRRIRLRNGDNLRNGVEAPMPEAKAETKSDAAKASSPTEKPPVPDKTPEKSPEFAPATVETTAPHVDNPQPEKPPATQAE